MIRQVASEVGIIAGRLVCYRNVFRIGLTVAAVLWMPSATPAQPNEPPVSTLSPEQLKTEIERLYSEVEAKYKSPDAPATWKAARAAEEQFNKSNAARAKEQQAQREEVAKLWDTPDARRWGDTIQTLLRRLQQLQIEDRRLASGDGSRLAQARHAELAKAALPDTPRLRNLGLDVSNYPQMDGSTSCQPLAALIACRCFGARYAWVGREQRLLSGMGIPGDMFTPREPEYMSPGPEAEYGLTEFLLQAATDEPAKRRLGLIINRDLARNASTHEAYVNLIEGRSDIGLLARRPSPDELQLAGKRNIELETVPCALDAFVFVVNSDNPVRNLSTSQIRDIYSGKTKVWNQAGGAGGRINAYQREEESGSQQLMRTLVMKGLPFEIENPNRDSPDGGRRIYPPQLIGAGMNSIFLQLTQDKWGLGYSVHYYERYMSGSPRTRTIAVDGVEPTFDTIRDRKYPYVTEVYVVTRKGVPETDPALRLRDWLLSPEGQAVVRESGYVPLPSGK